MIRQDITIKLAHGLRETHQPVERHRVVCEIIRLLRRDAERVRRKGQARERHVVRDDVACNRARAVRHLELLVRVDEGRRRLRAEERVVPASAARR